MKSNIFHNSNELPPNALGLDLGTTNSVVTAKISDGLPIVLSSKSGQTTPSCVTFNEDGTYIIGSRAYEQRHLPNTIYSFKKFMGTNKKLYRDYTPRNISSMFVKELLNEIKELNPQFSNYNAIQVSVPAYFDINQRDDTRLAIEDAGYQVVGIIDEPTSAALLYQQAKRIIGDILIFDLGGGTFDGVLVRNVQGIPADTREFYKNLGVELEQSESVLEILDVSGDNQLGGDDIDTEAVKAYLKHYKMKVSEEDKQKLLLCAEKTKKFGVATKPDFTDNMFKFEFVEKGTMVIFKRCMEIVTDMLNRAKVYDVHCVLCGGSTKSNIIRKQLSSRFTISTDIDPDLAVGVGNSIKYHMQLSNSGISIVSRLAKGVGVLDGDKIKYLIDKGTVIPLSSRFVGRNSEPFSDFVDIDLYQGDRFTGENTHISTISLRGIKDHDEEGYAKIILVLTITSDGSITVEVSSGQASVKANLVLNEVDEPKPSGVHPDAKFYKKFLNAAETYDDDKLVLMVEEYKHTGSHSLARDIMQHLGKLATAYS